MKPGRDADADELLESLLDSLLKDFDHWFHRGQELLQDCPDSMGPQERERMAVRVEEGLRAIEATAPWFEPAPRR